MLRRLEVLTGVLLALTAAQARAGSGIADPVALPGAAETPAAEGWETPLEDDHYIDEADLPFAAIDGLDSVRLWGVYLGAAYRIEVPVPWNGDLVVWQWGFRGFCLKPDDPACRLLAPEPWIRRHLLERGFAWASSSLTTSGWAVSQGVLDDLALLARFVQLVGMPERTYMIGVSMGGKIVALSNETDLPYAGTLSLCGDLGRDELADFWVDWSLLAATLAHQEADVGVPAPPDYGDTVVPAVRAALGSPFPTSLSAAGEKLREAAMRVSGGRRPHFADAFALADSPVFGIPATLFDLFGGDSEFALLLNGDDEGRIPPWPIDGNERVLYQLDDDPALSRDEIDLNYRVPRIPARTSGTRFDFPHVDGDLTRPMLAVQNVGDLLVPLSITQLYAQRTREHGKGELLVTRATRGLTHCGFTVWEVESSFDALVGWVETGVRPPGDDLLDASAVAEPDFGCAWSGDAPGVPQHGDEDICTAP